MIKAQKRVIRSNTPVNLSEDTEEKARRERACRIGVVRDPNRVIDRRTTDLAHKDNTDFYTRETH